MDLKYEVWGEGEWEVWNLPEGWTLEQLAVYIREQERLQRPYDLLQ